MKKKICPVCDQEIRSLNYCRICRRFVRKPYIREINYYLNETHPRKEADCSYHKGRPQAGWQRRTPPGETGRPGYQTSHRQQPIRTAAKESNKWILFLAVFFVMVFLGSTRFFRFAATRLNHMGPDRGYDIDPGFYEPDWNFAAGEEEGRRELEDAEVRAAGERCTVYAHFSVTLDEVETEIVEIVEHHGYRLRNRGVYSYNTRYAGGDGNVFSSYCTWTSYKIEEEPYSYQKVYFNHDTVTDELHEIGITLNDREQVLVISGEVLELLTTMGVISSSADYERILTGINQQSFAGEEHYITADGRVELRCYYDDSYSIAIYPYGAYDQ